MDEAGEAGEASVQKGPEVGKDLADVVTAAAEHGAEGVTDGALEDASGETSIGLHVSDLGLDDAAAAQELGQLGREAAPSAADEHRRAVGAMAAVAAIDHGKARAGSGEGLDLLQGVDEGVPVVGIAGHEAHAHDKAASERGSDADLGPELVADACFAL